MTFLKGKRLWKQKHVPVYVNFIEILVATDRHNLQKLRLENMTSLDLCSQILIHVQKS